MSRRHPTLAVLAIWALVLVGATGCSSDTKESAKDTARSVKEDAANGVDAAGARAAAEALRVSLKGNDTADEEGIRSVKAIRQAAEDLPGDPTVTGIADGNGDGKDDDGKVQVEVGDHQSCLTLPTSGEDTKVTDGPC